MKEVINMEIHDVAALAHHLLAAAYYAMLVWNLHSS